MNRQRKRTLPIDAFALPRCKACRSTRLRTTKSKPTLNDDGSIAQRTAYVTCLSCGRKSWGIFD